MFSLRKRVFAGKGSLQPEPFCPYLTDLNGHASLLRSTSKARMLAGVTPHARPSLRDGKHRL